jgi:hypothetical protein
MAPNIVLTDTPPQGAFQQKWPVSRRVNSSRTSDENATLIDRIELAVAD